MNLLEHPDAMAAYGVLLYEKSTLSFSDPAIVGTLERQLVNGYARVRLGAVPAVEDSVAAALATAWQAAVQSYPGDETGRGIRVRLELADTEEWRAVYERLRRATSVSSVFLADFACAGRRHWHWPVRVAVPPGQETQNRFFSYAHPDLVQVIEIGSGFTSCDIAMLATSEVAGMAGYVGPSLVLLTDVDPVQMTPDKLSDVATLLGASATIACAGTNDTNEFTWRFLDGLAHNHAPDLAFAMAVGDADYLMVGDPEFIDAATVTSVIAELRRAVEDAWGNGLLQLGDMNFALDELRSLEGQPWTSEGGAGTVARRVVGTVEPMVTDATVTRSARSTGAAEVTASPRYLQSQVNDLSSGSPQRRLHAFRPGARHEVVVRIGRTSAEWNGAEIEFPELSLPPEERHHELTIDLRAPDLFDGTKSETVVLGQVGDSNTAAFLVDVPAGLDRVEMGVSVFYGVLHLQSAILSGRVSTEDHDPTGYGIRMQRGDASAVDLDTKPDIDLSFTKERDTIKVARRDQEPWHVDLPGIDDQVAILRNTLFQAAGAVQQLETPLDEGDGLQVLVTLAQHGSVLRDLLAKSHDFGDSKRVSVTSSASGDYLPVEFLYDFGLPDDNARLCPQFLSTRDGLCDGCEARGDTRFVCPSGFWGLNRHLEQRVWAMGMDGSDGSCLAPVPLPRQPNLPEARHVIFAASTKVNEGDDQNRIAGAIAGIKNAIGDRTLPTDEMTRVHIAEDWTTWQDHVRSHHPALLVTLPHKVRTAHAWEALQIGADQDLALIRLEEPHVMQDGQTVGPIVLLLGCDTANARVQYQDFVQRFRCKGAPVVVGTFTSVLGPEMSRVAEGFVGQLWQAKGEATFGEVMQRVRTNMLRSHNLMTLALVAYGDADWRFTPGGN